MMFSSFQAGFRCHERSAHRRYSREDKVLVRVSGFARTGEGTSAKERSEMSTHPEAQISRVMMVLDRLRCPHRILDAQSPEAVSGVEWIETRFPFLYTQVDWSKVPSHSCVPWQTVDDLVGSFRMMTKPLPLSSLVLVMWNDAGCPAIELTLFG